MMRSVIIARIPNANSLSSHLSALWQYSAFLPSKRSPPHVISELSQKKTRLQLRLPAKDAQHLILKWWIFPLVPNFNLSATRTLSVSSLPIRNMLFLMEKKCPRQRQLLKHWEASGGCKDQHIGRTQERYSMNAVRVLKKQ